MGRWNEWYYKFNKIENTPDLYNLSLTNCHSVKSLKNFKKLEDLYCSQMNNLESIENMPSLLSIYCDRCPELKKVWYTDEIVTFQIEECPKLTLSGIGCFEKLESSGINYQPILDQNDSLSKYPVNLRNLKLLCTFKKQIILQEKFKNVRTQGIDNAVLADYISRNGQLFGRKRSKKRVSKKKRKGSKKRVSKKKRKRSKKSKKKSKR